MGRGDKGFVCILQTAHSSASLLHYKRFSIKVLLLYSSFRCKIKESAFNSIGCMLQVHRSVPVSSESASVSVGPFRKLSHYFENNTQVLCCGEEVRTTNVMRDVVPRGLISL